MDEQQTVFVTLMNVPKAVLYLERTSTSKELNESTQESKSLSLESDSRERYSAARWVSGTVV
jgi:hypothetical protein